MKRKWELLSRFVWLKYGHKTALLCKSVEVVGDLLTPIDCARMIDLVFTGQTCTTCRYGILAGSYCHWFLVLLVCRSASIVSQRTGTDLRSELFIRFELQVLIFLR